MMKNFKIGFVVWFGLSVLEAGLVQARPNATTGDIVPFTGLSTTGLSTTSSSGSTSGSSTTSTGVTPATTGSANPANPATPATTSLNPELKACLESSKSDITSGGISTTLGCDQVQHPLRLFQPGASGSEVTGLYDLRGVRCPDSSLQVSGTTMHGTGECQILVQAWWKGECMDTANAGGQCKRIKTITTDYKVSQLDPVAGVTTMAPVISGSNSTTSAQNRPSLLIGYAAIANGQQGQDVTCANINPSTPFQMGIDASGNPICGVDPNAQLISNMQTQICQLETTQVNANGGETTTCNPPVKVIKLVNGVHKTTDCTGTIRDLNGNPVANPTVAQNKQLFCAVNGACPAGWAQYANWGTTLPNTCRGGITHKDSGCGSSGQCDYVLNITTGSHSTFQNLAAETRPYSNCHVAYNHHGFLNWGCDASTHNEATFTCIALPQNTGCY